MASEKQSNFIRNLYEDIKKYAPEADPEKAAEAGALLKNHKKTIAEVMKEEDVSFQAASDAIGDLIAAKKLLEPRSATVRWKKVGNDWLISGPADLVLEDQEVEVHSKKGVKKVTVGRIHSTDGDKVLAHPKKEKEVDVEPGFYFNDDDDIIEAYRTQNGFLVARWIEAETGERTYLGKAGLKNLVRKLTLEEVEAFGKKTGICMICGAKLENPESVERGIGPICAAKWG